MFTSSIKRRLRRFHGAVDVRQRNVLKSVMHVHSCHFARKNQLFLSLSSPVAAARRRRCLGSLTVTKTDTVAISSSDSLPSGNKKQQPEILFLLRLIFRLMFYSLIHRDSKFATPFVYLPDVARVAG